MSNVPINLPHQWLVLEIFLTSNQLDSGVPRVTGVGHPQKMHAPPPILIAQSILPQNVLFRPGRSGMKVTSNGLSVKISTLRQHCDETNDEEGIKNSTMRSVLRDRDHVVLHRARSLPSPGPMKSISDVHHEKNRQPKDIRVHFSPTEPFSLLPTSSASPAAMASTSRRGGGGLGITELFRLVEIQKYSLAIQRLYQFPKEASMWVTVSGSDADEMNRIDPNDDPTQGPPERVSRGSSKAPARMMLPVHLACEHLTMHPKDAPSDKRRKLEALMAHLVSVFPASCLRRNPAGQLPLHAALRHGASVETITALLCAAPESLIHVDTSAFPHLTPAQINNQLIEGLASPTATSAEAQDELHRLDVVRQMLARGVDFWDMAKQEATLRIKHRVIPPEDASIGSLSVLATSFNHDDASTLATASLSQTHQRQMHHFFQHQRHDHQQQHAPEASAGRHVRPSPFLRRNTVSFRRRPSSSTSRQAGIPEDRSGDEDDENTVNRLLDRIRALEYDKERLRNEVNELQSELARQEAIRNELGRPPMNGADSYESSVGPRTPPPQHRAQDGSDGDRPNAVHKLRREKETLERKVDALTKRNQVYQNLLHTFTSLHAHPPVAQTLDVPTEVVTEGGTHSQEDPNDARSSPEEAKEEPVLVPPPLAASDPNEGSGHDPSSLGTATIFDGFEVDSVILRAEQLAGHRLSQEMVDAWRTATSSDSVSELGSTSDGQRDVSPLGDDDLDDDDDDDEHNVYDDVTCLFSTSSRSTASPGPRSVL